MSATLPSEESILEQAVETGAATLENIVILPSLGMTIIATNAPANMNNQKGWRLHNEHEG